MQDTHPMKNSPEKSMKLENSILFISLYKTIELQQNQQITEAFIY